MLNGKDTAGNEVTLQKKVLSLDLDIPTSPIIISNAGYPVLSNYGVLIDGTTKITYDSRTDIDNLYSVDNGTTWKVYTGQFNMTSGTVIAKSVKKATGLEISLSKTIGLPSDALRIEAYDGNLATATGIMGTYMKVDSSMIGKKIYIRLSGFYDGSGAGKNTYVRALDSSSNILAQVYSTGATSPVVNPIRDLYITIPANTEWIQLTGDYWGGRVGNLYEIQTTNEPIFTAKNGYMLIAADASKCINYINQSITIDYFSTSVQRLYRIGTTGDWLNYQDQPIIVPQGQTIYAKGIDKTGVETRLISSYTSNSSDAMQPAAFDGNINTATGLMGTYMKVDSSMIGKKIYIRLSGFYDGSGAGKNTYVRALDSSSNILAQVYSTGSTSPVNPIRDLYMIIPANTEWIQLTGDYWGGRVGYLYEIQTTNEPIFTAKNGYMTIASDSSKCINYINQSITIDYFPTSVQRLYRIGTTGDWLNYNDQPIIVPQGQTIYAKGIDRTGIETRLISSYTSNSSDSMQAAAFDGNINTATGLMGTYIKVDSSMIGKQIYIRLSGFYDGSGAGKNTYVSALNSSKTTLTYVYSTGATSPVVNPIRDLYMTIPANTEWLYLSGDYWGGRVGYLYEIQPVQLGSSLRGYIPTMTSNTVPSPFVASASSIYRSDCNAYVAFDNNIYTTYGWISLANDINDGNAWLQIKLDKAIRASKYYIIARNDGGLEQTPKDWILQGSNNGTSWTDIDQRNTEINWNLGEIRWYTINLPSSYQYYRIYVTANNGLSSGANYVTIDEMNIFE